MAWRVGLFGSFCCFNLPQVAVPGEYYQIAEQQYERLCSTISSQEKSAVLFVIASLLFPIRRHRSYRSLKSSLITLLRLICARNDISHFPLYYFHCQHSTSSAFNGLAACLQSVIEEEDASGVTLQFSIETFVNHDTIVCFDGCPTATIGANFRPAVSTTSGAM